MSQSNKGDTNDIGLKIVDILDNAGVKEDYPDFKDLSKTHSPRAEAKQAIQNLIAQETNKARLDELTWARDMAEKDITGHSLISLNYVNQRIQALTADKEQKP